MDHEYHGGLTSVGHLFFFQTRALDLVGETEVNLIIFPLPSFQAYPTSFPKRFALLFHIVLPLHFAYQCCDGQQNSVGGH